MKVEAEELAAKLKDIFGERAECRFINIKTDEIKAFPETEKIINQVLLPMTLVNGIPRLHGYIDQDRIIDTVRKLLSNKQKN